VSRELAAAIGTPRLLPEWSAHVLTSGRPNSGAKSDHLPVTATLDIMRVHPCLPSSTV
jgi:hypothetical protein